MVHVAEKVGVGFVPLFEMFLDMEHRLAGDASLYADEIYLGVIGDQLYSHLVYEYSDLH